MTAAVRHSMAPVEALRSNRPYATVKQKLAAIQARPRSVTFRPAGDEIKNVVITNAMLSRPQESAAQTHAQEVNFVNQRALGKVVTSTFCITIFLGVPQ